MKDVIELIIIFLLFSSVGGFLIFSTVSMFYTITFFQGFRIMGLILFVSHTIKKYLKYIEEN